MSPFPIYSERLQLIAQQLFCHSRSRILHGLLLEIQFLKCFHLIRERTGAGETKRAILFRFLQISFLTSENVVKFAGRLSGNCVGYYKDASWEYLSYGERRKIEIESEKLTRRMPKDNPKFNPVSGVAKVGIVRTENLHTHTEGGRGETWSIAVHVSTFDEEFRFFSRTTSHREIFLQWIGEARLLANCQLQIGERKKISFRSERHQTRLPSAKDWLALKWG